VKASNQRAIHGYQHRMPRRGEKALWSRWRIRAAAVASVYGEDVSSARFSVKGNVGAQVDVYDYYQTLGESP